MRFWLGGSLRLSCILHNLFRDAHLHHVWRAYCAYCAPNTLNRSKTIISKDKGKGQFQNRVHGVLLQQLLEHSWRLGLPGPCFILANPDQVLSLSITSRIPIHRLFSDLVNFGFFHRFANFWSFQWKLSPMIPRIHDSLFMWHWMFQGKMEKGNICLGFCGLIKSVGKMCDKNIIQVCLVGTTTPDWVFLWRLLVLVSPPSPHSPN